MDTTLGVAIVIATFVGPIAAVLITRWIDNKRANRDRQLEVFRALMRTRKAGLQPDHVNALNLVEIEFHEVTTVITAYRELMRHINAGGVADDKWLNTHRSYLTKLLSAMATALGYTIEQLDVFEGGYYPTGWGQAEEQQLAMRLGLIELLSGKRSLPVHDAKQIGVPQGSPFQAIADRLTKPNPPPQS
jgi:hypothetical protein